MINKRTFFSAIAIFGAALFFYFGLVLLPVSSVPEILEFKVSPGDGFSEIARRLEEKKIIRSASAFRVVSFISGSATRLKPGNYFLSTASSTPEIISKLVNGARREVEVQIPDGASVYLIDKILSDSGVLSQGEFISYIFSLSQRAEGKLFPDTYRFFIKSSPEKVFEKMQTNFREKALPVLAAEPKKIEENLILASLLEKEVPDSYERRIVAGILKKRLAQEMRLEVDATICYVKQRLNASYVPCYPLTESDFKIESPYNTYLNKGLPPGPIGSPGLDAIQAAMNPLESDYWFYLSDPKTKKTIFSRTLDEHSRNRVKYLSGK